MWVQWKEEAAREQLQGCGRNSQIHTSSSPRSTLLYVPVYKQKKKKTSYIILKCIRMYEAQDKHVSVFMTMFCYGSAEIKVWLNLLWEQ